MKPPFYPAEYLSELSFRNKLGRTLWGAVWICLFRPSPRILFGWRRCLLRCFGAKMAASAKVYSSTRIWAPWNLEMGERSALGEHVNCFSVEKVTLHEDVMVSQGAFLCGASHDIERADRRLLAEPIILERGSWVFSNAFVAMGVRVGEGAVVAAMSVVTRDVAPYSVVGGNPARLIRERKVDWEVRGG